MSFVLFTIVYFVFLFRVSRDRNMWLRDATRGKLSDWRFVAYGLVVSCIFVIVSHGHDFNVRAGGGSRMRPQIRSVYRILEAILNGGDSKLARSEAAFYALDGFPIWLAMAVFVVFWPGRVLMLHYNMESVASKSTVNDSIPLDRV